MFLKDFAVLEYREYINHPTVIKKGATVLNFFLLKIFFLSWLLYLTLFVKHQFGAEEMQQVPCNFYF